MSPANTDKSCYAVVSNRLSFPLILTFSLWERAEVEGSPNLCLIKIRDENLYEAYGEQSESPRPQVGAFWGF